MTDEPDERRELPPIVRAPWTDNQLESLKGFQLSPYWHEFTCGRCGSLLYPEFDGWHCSGDDYAQDWAHEFMTNWAWQRTADLLTNLIANVDYCGTCDHPVSYHGNDGCSMPVQQGTYLPITRGATAGVPCGCEDEWVTE